MNKLAAKEELEKARVTISDSLNRVFEYHDKYGGPHEFYREEHDCLFVVYNNLHRLVCMVDDVVDALEDNQFDTALAYADLKKAFYETKEDFEELVSDNLKTSEAHDKAILAMMFHNLVNFDPKNETHVKGLSAILSADRVVKPNTVNYYDYLKSPQWQSVRDAALKRANYQCEKCKSAKNLEVHHITYKRLGYELPEDLIVLCKDCHENVHSKDLKQNDDFFANSSEGFPEGF